MTYNVMHLNGAERQEKKMVESQNMSNFLCSNSADSEKEMCVWQIISVCDSLSVYQISSAHAKLFFYLNSEFNFFFCKGLSCHWMALNLATLGL